MELISTADGARLLGITPRMLYKVIDAHRLTAYRCGRVIRLDLDEVWVTGLLRTVRAPLNLS